MAVHKLTDPDFQVTLEAKDLAIVKYYADWCGSCKLLAPKFRRLSEDDRFTGIGFYEVNAEEEESSRKAAGVDNLPYFAIFRNGKLVEGSASGKEEGIISLLEKLKEK